MSLDLRLNEVLEALLTHELNKDITTKELISCIDLTLLDTQASAGAINALQTKALQNDVAALCIYSQHIPVLAPAKGTIALATVVNFPQGTDNLNSCLQEVITAKELGAKEIDYVFPYQAYLGGDKDTALNHCKAIARECANLKLKFKVILETGAFTSIDTIYQVSKDIIGFGCNYLKTSTGKIPAGASLSAVFALLAAIKDSESNCGVKISGGVKTPAQALAYAQLAELVLEKKIDKTWFRIGASSLLDALI